MTSFLKGLQELFMWKADAMIQGKKAILIVSFGTSFHQAREKNISRIEKDIAEAFPGYWIYRAWTSRIITEKILRRDGIRIPSVKEAIEQMLEDGITHVIVQPTHLMDGIENRQMKEDMYTYGNAFEQVSFGEPLLATAEDQERAIRAVMEGFAFMEKDQVLVLMGHGTSNYTNFIYTDLDNMLKNLGYPHVFLGTIEGHPHLDTLLEKVGGFHPRKVLLTPFLVVAGKHAIHDMSGENPDSWKSRFEAEGFDVECIMKGLGEYPGIRRLYVEHAKAAELRLP